MINLVTGGAGFLGSHLAETLVARDQPVRILDIAELGLSELEEAVEFVQGDIRDRAVVEAACEGVDVIYHTIALVPLAKAGRGFTDVNVGGTRVLYDAALRAGVRKVVHVSSSAVYGVPAKFPITEASEINPLGAYGKAKYEGEQLCAAYRRQGLSISIIRPRTIVGTRRLGIFHILYDWIRRGKRIYLLGSGNNLFQLVSLRDVSDACILAAERGGDTVYNIGAAEYGTLREDLQRLIDHAATGARLVSLPAAPIRWTLQVLDKLNLSPLAEWHYRTVDKPFYFDITRAQQELGWQPRDSNIEMLIESYAWYLENREAVEQQFGTRHRLAPEQGILKLIRRLS